MLQDFLANRPTAAATPVTKAAAGGAASGFRPLLASGVIKEIRSNRPAAAGAPGEAEPASDTAEPQIELVQAADGTVQKIIVTCACCRRIELECEY